jgi:hypothetical protein
MWPGTYGRLSHTINGKTDIKDYLLLFGIVANYNG